MSISVLYIWKETLATHKDNEVLFSLFVSKENVKQHLHGTNIFKSP